MAGEQKIKDALTACTTMISVATKFKESLDADKFRANKFSSVASYPEGFILLAKAVEGSPLEFVDNGTVENFVNAFSNAVAAMNEGSAINPTQMDAHSLYVRAAERINEAWKNAFNLAPKMASLYLIGVGAKVSKSLDDITGQSERREKNAVAALEQAKTLLAEKVAQKQAEHFRDIALTFEDRASKWRTAVFVLASIMAVLLIIAILVPLPAPASWTAPAEVQIVVSRVLLVSLLTYFLVFCSHQYAAATHNAVMNRHRENALNTYRAIVEASGAPGTKDAILSQAAKAIFTPQPSGYLRKEPEGGSGNAVVEVLRSLKG